MKLFQFFPIGASLVASSLAIGCGPDNPEDACAGIVAGDLVISEVFADYAGVTGASGADDGQEWFEIYNASGSTIDITGLAITLARPDDTKAKTHVVKSGMVPAGGYFVLGGADPTLLPSHMNYGYGTSIGDMFNTDGGKLSLTCGEAKVDIAQFDNVKPGKSREFDGSIAPEYQANDDLARWCESNTNEFIAGNFGTPGEKSSCAPVLEGTCNDGGTMRATKQPLPGELVITEVMPRPAKVGATAGEWFEVQAMADVDLNGLGLDRVGDTSMPNLVSSANCLRLAAGSRAVFAKNSDSVMNGGLPTPQGLFSFALVDGSAAAPGDVQIVIGTTVIDSITWTKSTSGAALQLSSDKIDATENDEPSNFCDATAPYGLGDFGTPGMANAVCNTVVAGSCLDAVTATSRPIVKPTAGQLVITEFMASPAGDDAKEEWFEVKNTSGAAIDLNGLGLDREGDTALPNLISAAECKSVPAGGYALFARNTDVMQNGNLPKVDATFSFSLVTGNTTPGDIRIMDGVTVLDKITWTSAGTGLSTALDPDSTDVTANDSEANFCRGATVYSMAGAPDINKGTPKADNEQCP